MNPTPPTICARSDIYDIPGFISLCINLFIISIVSLITWINPQFVPSSDILSSYPSSGSTISNTMLITYTVSSYFGVLIFLSYLRCHFPDWIRPFNPWAATWLWGSELTLTGTLSQFFKYFVGRPRPDLYAECGPDAQFNHCTGVTGDALDNLFMSWPSGHATFSFGGFLYVALFVKVAVNTDQSWVSTLAILLTMVAFWIGATRISDYKHHAEDVTAGFFLAAFVTVMLWYRGWKRVFPKNVDTGCGTQTDQIGNG
jgi:phosphatidate phosphatase